MADNERDCGNDVGCSRMVVGRTWLDLSHIVLLKKRWKIEAWEHQRRHLRCKWMLYRFRFRVYQDAALSETACRDWFHRFKDGEFDVNDRPSEGRPKTFEDTELGALLDEDPCQTQQELSPAL
ncbi:hypothetical protein Trydic_g4020 [Trypoxylus dichotomus]